MRTVMITGAARGLGAEYAKAFAGLGYQVAAVDVAEVSDAVKAAGPNAQGFQADMTSEKEVAQVVAAIESRWGAIDVLVNNVGAFPGRPFLETDLTFWHDILRINVDSAFLACRYVLPGMVQRQYGRIINIASGTVFKGPALLTAYVTAKAGIIGLTRSLSTEFGSHNITVNCVAPGLTDTPGARSYTNNLTGEDANIERRAIHRRETPADVVAAVTFFASEAAGFVTGQTLVVDGGNVKH